MQVQIRDAVAGDATVVAELIQELGAASGYASPVTEEYTLAYLAHPGCGVLLAEADGQMLGLLSYSVRPDLFHAANSCLIDELVVGEAHRGRGVGSALMQELLHRAASAGCVEVSVAAMPDNEAAIALYRSHGLVDEAVLLETHLS